MRRLHLALALLATACDPPPRSAPPAPAPAPTPTPAPPPAAPPRTPAVARYVAEPVRRIAHTPDAFTQGFAFHGPRLFESTGLNGQSSVRELDPNSGRVLRRRDVAEEHFAEGLTVFNGRIFQITWRSQRAFVYELDTFAPSPNTATWARGGASRTTVGSSS
ncbi:MAG: glutaminyl-peptide cyclotransferase [Polyangiales bacterium]